MSTRLYHQQTSADPTLRSYMVGDEAAEAVVRAAGTAPYVAVDIETQGLAELSYRIKVVIIATTETAYVLDATNSAHQAAIRYALDVANMLVFHNSAFDVPPLVYAGLMDLQAVDKVVDTLIYSRLAHTGSLDRHGLAELERRYLSKRFRSPRKDLLAEWGKNNGFTKAEVFANATYQTPVYVMYAGWDGIVTALLFPEVYRAAIRQLTNHPFGRYGADTEQAHWICEREQIVNRVMLRRSARGIEIDSELLAAEQERLRQVMNELADELATAGIPDPSNRNQLVAALEPLGVFGEDYPRTKTGKLSTAKAHLGAITHELARQFRAHDENRRLFTYLEQARVLAARTDGKLHPQVDILKARTGRMAYGGGVPLQQFTKPARKALRADQGDVLFSADWSQFEPVILANLAGDAAVLEQYENPKPGQKQDLYTTAKEASGVERSVAKTILLGMAYGQGIKALSGRLGVSPEEGKNIQAQIAAAMPMTLRLMGWSEQWTAAVGKTFTVSGRIIDCDPEFAYRGVNYLAQGSNYDVLAECLASIHAAGLSDAVYLAVHDELVVSKDAAEDITRIMVTPIPRLVELAGRVPKLRVDGQVLGERWDKPSDD